VESTRKSGGRLWLLALSWYRVRALLNFWSDQEDKAQRQGYESQPPSAVLVTLVKASQIQERVLLGYFLLRRQVAERLAFQLLSADQVSHV
jgi:hypothetical protein